MKKISSIIFGIVCFISCKNKEADVSANLLFNIEVSDYQNIKYDTKIALSDSVLVVQNYNVAHSQFTATDSTVAVFIKGVKKSGNFNFEKIINHYQLKEYSIREFSKPQTESQKSSCKIPEGADFIRTELSEDGSEYTCYNLRNNTYLSICRKNGETVIPLRKIRDALSPSTIKLLDLTGDGKEEVLLYTPVTNYREGNSYFVDVYKVYTK